MPVITPVSDNCKEMVSGSCPPRAARDQLLARVAQLRSRCAEFSKAIDEVTSAIKNGAADRIAELEAAVSQKSHVDAELADAERKLAAAECMLADKVIAEQRAELESCFAELAKISGGEFENLYLQTCLTAGRFFHVQECAVQLMNALRLSEPLALDMHGHSERLARFVLRDPRAALLELYAGNTNRSWNWHLEIVPLVEKFAKKENA